MSPVAVHGLPYRAAVRTVGTMDGMPRRIEPATDRTAAARMLGCAPDEVGYCPRCQGLTRRYGRGAQIICTACRAAEEAGRAASGAG
ncbi:hypothetical protein ACF1AB_36335 [Streptomyces sp. NPDC014846]|uniref:hypothetical protein n=1 Tax=Streptomyces sp. NPDC014846 TaxID=3364922 RepID=UPI0037003649